MVGVRQRSGAHTAVCHFWKSWEDKFPIGCLLGENMSCPKRLSWDIYETWGVWSGDGESIWLFNYKKAGELPCGLFQPGDSTSSVVIRRQPCQKCLLHQASSQWKLAACTSDFNIEGLPESQSQLFTPSKEWLPRTSAARTTHQWLFSFPLETFLNLPDIMNTNLCTSQLSLHAKKHVFTVQLMYFSTCKNCFGICASHDFFHWN